MRVTIVYIFSVILIILFTGASNSQENPVVFYSGFEEGNKLIWDDWDPNPDSTNLLMLDPGPFDISGNHVMRLRVPPGRGGADLVKVLPGSYDKLYARWYMMWEKGYDFTARNHGGGLHAGSRNNLGRSNYRPNGNDWFSSWIEPADGRMNLYTYYRGMYMDCANPNGQCWGDHFPCWFDEGENICDKPEHREKIMPPLMESGRWYCIEMMIDGGTAVQSDVEADGIADFWIDGIEYGPFKHLWWRTTEDLKLNVLWLSLFHHGEHSVEGILLDEVVVSTERIGCTETNIVEEDEEVCTFNIVTDFSNKLFEVVGKGKVPTDTKIQIYSILGDLLKSFVVNGDKRVFSYEDLPMGFYILRICNSCKTDNKKLILW
jgi:hypothetical protein